MLNYKEFMETLKQTIYSQTGWKSDCMGSVDLYLKLTQF